MSITVLQRRESVTEERSNIIFKIYITVVYIYIIPQADLEVSS